MPNVLVFGAYGLLGSSLCPYLESVGYNVFRQGRKSNAQISIHNIDSNVIKTILEVNKVDCVINLIALTSIDLCEKHIKKAYNANIGVLESVVSAIHSMTVKKRPHLITISTDHVYDGLGPHKEYNVSPCNVYALSKLAGEFIATQVDATILRTNFIGKSNCRGRKGLTDWIVDSLRSGKEITVYEDVKISPLHITTLCTIIVKVIKENISGTYNLGCTGGNSKAYLAFEIAKKIKCNTSLMMSGKLMNNKQFVKRPFDMRMNSTLFEDTFNCKLPTFNSQISIAAREYMNE